MPKCHKKVCHRLLSRIAAEGQRRTSKLNILMFGLNIVRETKTARLRWLGHVERVGEDHAIKELT